MRHKHSTAPTLNMGREQERMIRQQRKHPGCIMPFPGPADPSPAKAQTEASIPSSTATEQPISWTMLPTLEEFGISRPLDVPGQPGHPGEARWPMMSRTMTHVSTSVYGSIQRD